MKKGKGAALFLTSEQFKTPLSWGKRFREESGGKDRKRAKALVELLAADDPDNLGGRDKQTSQGTISHRSAKIA